MIKKSVLKNPRWQTAAILKNVKRNVSAVALPDGKRKIGKFQNSRWRTAAILKIEKSRYLRNRLFDFDEIVHYDAY